MVARADFDTLRSLGFAGISAAYAPVGGPTTKRIRGFCITNNTAGDLLMTNDTSTDKWFVKAGSFKLWDVQSNMNAQFDDEYVLPIGTQFSVKQLTAPTSGAVYVEILC